MTGAAGGLGGAICERLVELGAFVAYLDLQAPQGVTAPHLAIACDITDEASVRAAAAEVEKRLGACGILVNNWHLGAAYIATEDGAENLA